MPNNRIPAHIKQKIKSSDYERIEEKSKKIDANMEEHKKLSVVRALQTHQKKRSRQLNMSAQTYSRLLAVCEAFYVKTGEAAITCPTHEPALSNHTSYECKDCKSIINTMLVDMIDMYVRRQMKRHPEITDDISEIAFKYLAGQEYTH